MPELTVDGVELWYRETGAGEPLVLVHASGSQTELWGPAVGYLAASHRVIAYDRRGYGRSPHRPVRDHRRHVADAIEVIERLGRGPVVLVGHSSGANVALGAAARRPDLVRVLVVAEPPFHALRHPTRSLLAMIWRAKVRQLREGREAAASVFFRWATSYRTGGSAFDRTPAVLREMMFRNARSLLAELDPHPAGMSFEHLPMRALSAVTAPITFMLGELSQPQFHRAHAALVGAMPAIQTERIPGASHAMNFDAPVEFAAAVERGAALGG